MFQYFMNDILKEYLDVIAVCILDDVIIFSATPSEHITHVRSILQVLRAHQLYAKIEKCEFHKDKMTFVGYMVSKAGIGMDLAKVSAILEWPTPKSVNEVYYFLVFFFSISTANLSSITPPSLPLSPLSHARGLNSLGPARLMRLSALCSGLSPLLPSSNTFSQICHLLLRRTPPTSPSGAFSPNLPLMASFTLFASIQGSSHLLN